VSDVAASDTTSLFSDAVWLGDRLMAATITVSEARVLEVEPSTSCPAGAVDLSGSLVTPALVNAHTHLPMSALRALGGYAGRSGNVVEDVWFSVESQLTAADVRAFCRMGALECLLSGTGAVFEHYYFGEAIAEALCDTGLSGVVAPTLQDVAGPGVEELDAQIEATLAIHRDPALAARGIRAMWGPHATDTVSPELFRRVLSLDDDLGVHVHLAQSVEELRRAAARGRTPVEALDEVGVLERDALLVHGLLVTAADRERLDTERHVLGHCPWSQLQFAWPAPVDAWLHAGFTVAVGTDAGACNDTMNVQQELRLVATGPGYQVSASDTAFSLQGTMSAAEGLTARRRHVHALAERRSDPAWLLSTVGTGPGQLVPELGLGQLTPGALANLAVWDLRHPALWPARDPLRALTFGDAGAALHSLMVAGRWIGEPGRVAAILDTDDARAWREEADERLGHLLRRTT